MEQSGDDRKWMPSVVPDVPPPAGAYSRAIRAGDLVFVSGQVPKDMSTGAIVGAGIEEQTRAVLENLSRVLEAAGARLEDVVSVTAYLASEDDWPAFDRIYREHFAAPYPTRTTVAAGLRGVLVEISAIARV